jgi:hypothetical protein
LLQEVYYPLNKTNTKFVKIGYNWFADFQPTLILWDRVTNGQIFITVNDLYEISLFVKGNLYAPEQPEIVHLHYCDLTSFNDSSKNNLRILRFSERQGNSNIYCAEGTVRTMLEYQHLYAHNKQNVKLRVICENFIHTVKNMYKDVNNYSELTQIFEDLTTLIGKDNSSVVAEILYKFPLTISKFLNFNSKQVTDSKTVN